MTDFKALVGEYVDDLLAAPLAQANAVKAVSQEGDRLEIQLTVGLPTAGGYGDRLANGLYDWLQAEHGAAVSGLTVNITVDSRIRSHAVQPGLVTIPGIKNIIAVASGKGGVGKSTTAVNLALALQAEGAKVGLLDADIYGPSQPRMLGVKDVEPVSDGRIIQPVLAHGVKLMSMGFLLEEDIPTVWRGPMAHHALQQTHH